MWWRHLFISNTYTSYLRLECGAWNNLKFQSWINVKIIPSRQLSHRLLFSSVDFFFNKGNWKLSIVSNVFWHCALYWFCPFLPFCENTETHLLTITFRDNEIYQWPHIFIVCLFSSLKLHINNTLIIDSLNVSYFVKW